MAYKSDHDKQNWIQWIGLAVSVLVAFFIGIEEGKAAWQIDGPRFRESVHGENTCLDCHNDIREFERHPDPANIDRHLASFFSVDKCLACHEDVQEQISEGEHGGKIVADPEAFTLCIGCHDPHYEGAQDGIDSSAELSFSEDDSACLACHLGPTADVTTSAERSRFLCLSCHGAGVPGSTQARLIDTKTYTQTPHADLNCMTCHPGANSYPHTDQSLGDCRQCHRSHEESVAHDAHMRVSCTACHLAAVTPIRVVETGMVVPRRTTAPGGVSGIHAMTPLEAKNCDRCHFKGTLVGTAAARLPAKSVLCMPCHPATLSFNDITTIISLVIFGLGLLLFSSVWLGGDMTGVAGDGSLPKLVALLRISIATLFSAKIVPIVRILCLDVLLQRRLYRRSVYRWAIHSLIFLPLVVRFVWGILTLFSSNWLKGLRLTWVLLDKNHPVTAFVFDLTGLFIFLGIVLAFIRGGAAERTRSPGLPAQDRLALSLIGSIVLMGFILEAMRIALTGTGPMAGGAFIGYPMSYFFVGMANLSGVYGYCWYLHAILTGAFIAYLPFSHLMHIIMAPVVLAMNAIEEEAHK